MSRTSLALALLVALLALSTGCSGISVSTDYDPAVDFSKLHSFAWLKPVQALEGVGGPVSPLTHARIRAAVEAALAKRGYVQVTLDDAAKADFQVSYAAAVTREIESTPTTASYGYGWRHGAVGVATGSEIRTYDRGTLVIDLVDPRRKTLLWRGKASGAVDEDASPEEREAKIREAVEKVFDELPPERDGGR